MYFDLYTSNKKDYLKLTNIMLPLRGGGYKNKKNADIDHDLYMYYYDFYNDENIGEEQNITFEQFLEQQDSATRKSDLYMYHYDHYNDENIGEEQNISFEQYLKQQNYDSKSDSKEVENINQKDQKDKINKNQKGGGSWSVSSHGNDNTQDMIDMYNLSVYDEEKNDHIYHNTIKETDAALKKVFKDYEKYLMDKFKKSHSCTVIKDDVDFYDVPHNSDYLGIVIWMLEREFPIRVKYLYRSLANAYYEYFRIITIKEASGWKDWNERRLALINEIRLINYAINTAKNGIALIVPNKKHEKPCGAVNSMICDSVKKSPEKIMDKYYIRHIKRKPQYPFLKYSIEPGVDPRLLQLGTIMMGHNGSKNNHLEAYIVSLNNSHKKVWSLFDPFDSNYSQYIEDKYLIDLYGDQYYRVLRRK